jgi:Aspartyl protease
MLRLLLLLTTTAAVVAAAPGPHDVRLNLQPYFRDLRVVHVMAGQRPLTMLVDTGAGATAISPEIAAAIGCSPHGRDVGHRMTGEAVTFQRCESLTLSSGSWSHAFEPIGVFDVGALLPKELPHVDGILGLDAFRGHVITIDWSGNAILVVDRSRERLAVAASGAPFRAATGETGRFLTAYVPVRGARDPLWLLLDSGNLRGTIVADSVIKDGQLPLAADGQAVLAVGSLAAITSPYVVAPLAIDGALGTDYLKRGLVTLDLRMQEVRTSDLEQDVLRRRAEAAQAP